LSALITTRAEDGDALSLAELRGMAYLLLIAGNWLIWGVTTAAALITLAATALTPVSIGTFIALGGAVLDAASGILDAVAMGTGRNQLEDPLNIAAITLGAAGIATGIGGAIGAVTETTKATKAAAETKKRLGGLGIKDGLDTHQRQAVNAFDEAYDNFTEVHSQFMGELLPMARTGQLEFAISSPDFNKLGQGFKVDSGAKLPAFHDQEKLDLAQWLAESRTRYMEAKKAVADAAREVEMESKFAEKYTGEDLSASFKQHFAKRAEAHANVLSADYSTQEIEAFTSFVNDGSLQGLLQLTRRG
ncbi:hypothetical protein ABTY94_36860, partial [Streptomyces sp. NPDC096030]